MRLGAARLPIAPWTAMAALVLAAGVAPAQAQAPAAAPTGTPSAEGPPPIEPLPPTRAGRTVIADVPGTVLTMDAGPGDARALAAEDWAVIAEINRAPSTWQSYLLYTSEDLPERLFHPGFTFVLDRPKKQAVKVPEQASEKPADAQAAPPASEPGTSPKP